MTIAANATTYEEHPNDAADRSQRSLSPFDAPATVSNGAIEVAKQREVTETQGAIILARQFPRDQVKATDKILLAFQRPSLAEKAQYQYGRGGTDIVGPSIRAAETIAQNWGNLQTGWRELERRDGESSVEAFAWDMETNWRETRTFVVKHERSTRKGTYQLEDSRDIYELIANESARRKRSCILALIPGDIVEAAMQQAQQTLKTAVMRDPQKTIASLLEKFSEIGVTKQQIETRIQRRIDAVTPAQIFNLGRVYTSLADGMSEVADWFEVPQAPVPAAGSRADEIKSKIGVQPAQAAEPAAAATTDAETGPTDQEKLEAQVTEFLEAAASLNATEVLGMVKRLAATRGATDERDLAEIYKKATGKIAFTKAGLPAIAMTIYMMPEVPATTNGAAE